MATEIRHKCVLVFFLFGHFCILTRMKLIVDILTAIKVDIYLKSQAFADFPFALSREITKTKFGKRVMAIFA